MSIGLTDLACFDYVWLIFGQRKEYSYGTVASTCRHKQPLRRLGHHGLPSESHVLRLWRRSHKDASRWLRCTMAIHGPKNEWLIACTWNYHDLSMTYMATLRLCFIDLFLLGTFWSTIEFCTLLGKPANVQRKICGGSWKRFRTCSDERRNNASGHRISTLFTGAFKCTATFIVSFNDHFLGSGVKLMRIVVIASEQHV